MVSENIEQRLTDIETAVAAISVPSAADIATAVVAALPAIPAPTIDFTPVLAVLSTLQDSVNNIQTTLGIVPTPAPTPAPVPAPPADEAPPVSSDGSTA